MHLEQNPSQKPTKINNKGAVNSSMSWGFNSLRRSNQQEKKTRKLQLYTILLMFHDNILQEGILIN